MPTSPGESSRAGRRPSSWAAPRWLQPVRLTACLAFLFSAARVAAAPDPTAVPPPAPVESGCPLAPFENAAAVEARLRDWTRANRLEAADNWGLGVDRSRLRVELHWGGQTLVLGWSLDMQCAPTAVTIEASSGFAGPVPGEPEVRELAARLADISVQARRAPPWPAQSLLLAVSFGVLVLGTVGILYREAVARRPHAMAVAALALVSLAALALRLALSPRTFLHEGYHVAETLAAYLSGDMPPAYGKTGPALFRLAATLAGRPDDVGVVFLTNAVIASMAIPALALFDLALFRNWPRALCAAVLLCVLPLHLRYSAAEDLFVQATTFALWSLAMFALHLRTRRLGDAVCGALAASLAMQARPEMLFFPLLVVALVLLVEARPWRVLFSPPMLAAGLLVGLLLVPRLWELHRAVREAPAPPLALPAPGTYAGNLVFFQPEVTPRIYWLLALLGTVRDGLHRPGFHLWALGTFVAHTLFTQSIFANVPYDLRSQLLPNACLLLIAAGAASAWVAVVEATARYRTRGDASAGFNPTRRAGLAIGACVLAGIAAILVATWRPFVRQLGDQQFEWAFLERTIPRLPARGRLLSAIDTGGENVAAFPAIVLAGAGKRYETIDVRRAVGGATPWPFPAEDLLYYQGLYCYLAVGDRVEPLTQTAPCRAVRERYDLEPLWGEDVLPGANTWQPYAGGARGPFRIGFFRLRERRDRAG